MSTPLNNRQTDGGRSVLCSCCPLPYAVIRRGGEGVVLVIQSKHYGESHSNALTAEDLRRLLDEMEKMDG